MSASDENVIVIVCAHISSDNTQR